MKKRVEVMQYELPITIIPLEEGGYLARSDKLQGCMAEGETVEQALSYVVDVARNIIDLRKEERMVIPLRVIEGKKEKSKISFSLPFTYRLNV